MILPTSGTPGYMDHTNMGTGQLLTGSSTIVILFNEVANLIPHAGLLLGLLGAAKELIIVINEIRDNKDDYEYLVERVLCFIKHLSKESTQMNVSLQDDTSTLNALLLWGNFIDFLHWWVRSPVGF
jgi:hypothetical protein